MEYYLLNKSLEIVDLIDTYKSVIWTTRFYESGDFELYIPASSKLINVLKRDYLIVRADDSTQAMIIQDINIDTDIEQGNYITVTGKSLKHILDRRIIWQQTTLNGNVETCLRQLVTDNAINPSVADRKIDNLILGAKIGLTDVMSAQFTGDNLEETIQSICKSYKIGYDVLLDIENKLFIFIIFKGLDRSYNQSDNPFVVFSNEYENLLKTSYKSSSSNFKNVALVAGEGEGAARKTAVAGSGKGLDRYEIYVDARDVSTNEGEISDSEYNELLIERANEKLSEHSNIESIEGDVEANYTYKVNEDYFLGDIVEVINEYGVEMTPQITEIIESEDDSGKSVIPTFTTIIE